MSNQLLIEQTLELLKTSAPTISFIKKDGSLRKMKCTRNSQYIPGSTKTESTSSKTKSDAVITVYDLEKNVWRSITKANIVSVEN